MSAPVASFITEENPLLLRFGMISRKIGKKEFKDFCKANPDWHLELTAEGDLIIKPAKLRNTRTRTRRQMLLKELDTVNNSIEQIARENNSKYYFGRFLPNRTVMFVGEMPSIPNEEEWDSRDNFNLTCTDLKFIKLIDECGLGGSYITDIVKTCATPRRPTPEEIQQFKRLLVKEIEIVNPKVIVALGDNAYKILELHFPDIKSKLHKVIHPAGARYNRWDRCKEELEKIKKIVDELE